MEKTNQEKKKFYITTAIDYVNARPHIGHAFQKVLADAICRWHILNEEGVYFLTGTDENAQKNARAAKEKGEEVKEFVDKNSEEKLVSTYQNSMENLVGSEVNVEWKTKSGGTVKTKVILVPFFFNDHLFALHFINKL